MLTATPPAIRLETNLAAIAHNTRRFAAITPSLMAVVKADCFGHGEVARTMLENGASRLGVADLSEALDLRDQGIEAPILSWLNSPDGDYTAAAAREVEIAVGGIGQLERIASAAIEADRVARAHINVDLGMNREGAPMGEWVALCDRAAEFERLGTLRVVGLMGHMSCADDPGHEANVTARHLFDRARTVVTRSGLRPEVRHMAATAATLTAPDTHFDMCRVGAGIYGIDPTGRAGLRHALTVTAPVTMSRTVAAGTGVGYGHRFVAERKMNVATVAIGYADGVPRRAAGRARILIGGSLRPLVGEVSMDQITVDMGEDEVAEGADAVILGDGSDGGPTSRDWAGWIGTNEHEVVTGFGRRKPRGGSHD